MKKLGVFPIFLIALLAVSLTVANLPTSQAVVEGLTFYGSDPAEHSGSFGLMQYGYYVNLYSMLGLPSDWFLDYTMGIYLMNASNYGYFIGFHQYRGEASIYINPVLNGVYYGTDGQPYHTAIVYPVASLENLQVLLNYNVTTGAFSISENGVTLVSNTFSGMALENYKETNALGRQGVWGNVHLVTFGADNSDGSYNNPTYNGIDFKVYTNGVEDDSGGQINWTRYVDLLGAQETGSTGYSTVFHQSDSLQIQADANSGFAFDSYFAINNYAGNFYAPGYYTLDGRLVANLALTHIYASEPGQMLIRDAGLIGSNTLLPTGVILSNYVWKNATTTNSVGAGFDGYWLLYQVSGAYFDIPSVWDMWFSGAEITYNPQSAAIHFANPGIFRYWGSNYTIIANFVSLNFNPDTLAPMPTATPSAFGGFNFGFNFNTTINGLILSIAGAIIVFIGLLLLIKVHAAWMPGSILTVAGFLLTMAGQPGLIGFAAFSLEAIIFSIFLFNANDKRDK